MAGNKSETQASRELVTQTLDVLATSGIIGFAWLDDALVAFERFGVLADWIPLGEKITESVPYFIGLATDLLDLQDEPGNAFVLSNVGISGREQESLKVSFEVFWREDVEQYCLVVHRLGARAAAEIELIKQVRARRIAEENLRSAEAQLLEKEQLLGFLAADAPAAIAMFDREMRYLFATRSWSDLFGLAMEPIIGRAHADVVGNAGLIASDELAHCLAGGHIVSPICEFTNRDGTRELVQWHHAPWRRGQGAVAGVISFAVIVSAGVAKQRELERQNRQLRETNQRLEQFAAIVAHDLKVPLRRMSNALAELQQVVPDADRNRAAGIVAGASTIERQIARMEAMLVDLMAYVRAGDAAMRVTGQGVREPLDLAALVSEIAASQLNADGFAIHVAPGSPSLQELTLPLDIVLRNLIANAIVHHDRRTGTITVSVQSSDGQTEIAVSDDGPGIPGTLHQKIFEPFFQREPGRNAGGSGMGLTLVRQIVAQHGGAIEIVSPVQAQRGSCIVIKLINKVSG